VARGVAHVRMTSRIGLCTIGPAHMSDDQQRFLALLGRLPARLTAEQAAWVLNCGTHDVPILVSTRLLKPLGSPQANAVKFFATADVLELTKDRAWLVKMTNAVCHHWRAQNERRKGRPAEDGQNGRAEFVRVAAAS
jgi:hypothetical protein